MSFKLSADELMQLALREAGRASTHKVKPNPKVGAAIEVVTGEVIAGFHAIAGGPHAERVVLEECRAKNLATTGARMAITLEPCSHWGKTPPCTEALVAAGINEVAIPFLDPNPLVAGKGEGALRAKGVKIISGLRQAEAYRLNREWLWAHLLDRPFVTLKIATSENHVWKHERGWITSPAARTDAMSLRARVDCLITSGQTVRDDDPALTVRNAAGAPADEQPAVCVLSKDTDWRPTGKLAQHPAGFTVENWPSLELGLQRMAREKQYTDVMIEVGPTLAQEFLEHDLVDEIWRYVAGEELAGQPRDVLANIEKKFLRVETRQIDATNRCEKWLKRDRDEKSYLTRL